MDLLLTFLEGIITFVSPCILPMLPIYLAYFAGDAGAEDEGRTRRTIICALGFVLGFGLLFTLLGAFAGTLGSLLVRYQRVLDVVCGAVVVLLGLNYLGVLRIGVLNRTWRSGPRASSHGFAGCVLFGLVFAVGWSPCVGTFLASALSLAASSANALTGVGLLLCFSAGLGLPFVLSAVLINQLESAFTWIKKHYDFINKVCGGLLVAEGVLMAFGLLGA